MYLNYTTYAYYQDSLVMMSMRFPESKKEKSAKRQGNGQILSVSEEEIRAIVGVASTETHVTAISARRNDKHSWVLISVKKAKIGASRRSRHAAKRTLKTLIC